MFIFAKLLVLIFCAFFQAHRSPIDISYIVILLLTFILSCISSISQTTILSFFWSTWLITALFLSPLRAYLPLAILDITSCNSPLLWCIWSICFLKEGIISYVISRSFTECIFLFLLSACATLLQYSIKKSETLTEELKQFRDTSKEHELFIEEKNRRLREQQDAELYTATLKERNRIAREIHDNVGHLLTRSLLQVGAIKTINQNEVLKDLLESLHETLNTAMTSIRNSVHDLHNESIDLHSAIQEIIDNVTTFFIQFDYDIHTDVAKNIKFCFIAITKEAINNTLKHSNATKMEILIQEHPAFYQLLIQDNGTNPSQTILDGIGIRNMKDRVKSLNGTIKISNETGFKILISIFKT